VYHYERGTSVRSVSTKYYERNQYVAEFAKRMANGRRHLCEEEAPFLDLAKNTSQRRKYYRGRTFR